MRAIASFHRYRRFARRTAIVLAAAVVAPPLAWWVAVHVGTFPRERLEPRHAAALTILDAQGNVLRQGATSAGGRESWVPVEAVSAHLRNATIASEERRFWRHAGVGTVRVPRASWL